MIKKKKIRIFFEPIDMEVEIPDGLDGYDEENEINEIVYGYREEEILEKAKIDFWEE